MAWRFGVRADGQQYLYESFLDSGAIVAAECPTGACIDQIMPNDFAYRMAVNPQEMADLLAYLLGDGSVYP